MKIDFVTAHEILDTRGKPTIETTLHAAFQGRTLKGSASVPSGKSTGSHEAKELRDPDGGVMGAITNIAKEIAIEILDREWNSTDEIDEAMIALDGTSDKSRLGANAILSVSIAAQRLFAEAERIPLWKAIAKRAGTTPGAPRLFVNVMNGGVHADFKLPFQEHILVCEGKVRDAFSTAQAAFAELGQRFVEGLSFNELKDKPSTANEMPMGDEGGYAPIFETLEKPFEFLAELVAAHPGTSIAIDAAANELRAEGGNYKLLDKVYTPNELHALYLRLADAFPIHSIEDPFAEGATEDFARLTAALAGKALVVGDDFTVTNPSRVVAARETRAITAVLIKPNQIGTVKEAIEAVQATYTAGWAAICSHRSGETNDTFISDFAYGVGAHGVKAGGLGQKERLVKYERLLEIEREASMV